MSWLCAQRARRLAGECGFTMIEALVALALAAFLLATLATVTAQWLPRWKAGFGRAQNADLMGVGLDRIAADLAAAEYAGPGDGTQLLFQGTPDSVTFVRSAVGPNASAGLKIVQLAETENKRGTVLTRTRAAFVPDATRDALNDGAIEFTNPVVLVRPPYRVSFSYTGRDGRWRETWDDASQLPAAVQIAVRSAGAEQALAGPFPRSRGRRLAQRRVNAWDRRLSSCLSRVPNLTPERMGSSSLRCCGFWLRSQRSPRFIPFISGTRRPRFAATAPVCSRARSSGQRSS